MDKKPAELTGLSHCLDGFSVLNKIKQHRRAGDVITPAVMGHLLVMPAQLARVCIQRNQADGIQVVAGAGGVIHLRRRVSGTDINQAEFRVDGRCGID